MPNWCYNSMKITGTISEITRFKETCIRTDENKQAQLDFSAIEPRAPGADAYWAIEHWGTKGNAQDFRVTVDAPGCYEFHFDTFYSPPVPVWEKMAKMFPALEFSLSGGEPMMQFVFEGTIQGGKLELEYKHVPFELTDPKPDRASTSDNELKRLSCEWEKPF